MGAVHLNWFRVLYNGVALGWDLVDLYRACGTLIVFVYIIAWWKKRFFQQTHRLDID